MKKKKPEQFQIIDALPERPIGPIAKKWHPIIAALKPGQCIHYQGPLVNRAWIHLGHTLRIPLTTQRQPDGSIRIWKREATPNIRVLSAPEQSPIPKPQSAIQP